MHFGLTEEQDLLQNTVRDFAASEPVEADELARRSWWFRVGVRLARLLAPLQRFMPPEKNAICTELGFIWLKFYQILTKILEKTFHKQY